MIKYLLLIFGVAFYSCMPIKERPSAIKAVLQQFALKRAAALDCIAKDTTLYSEERTMFNKLDYLFQQTVLVDRDSLVYSREVYSNLANLANDSMYRNYCSEVKDLRNQFAVLRTGQLEIKDSSNKHVLAYESFNEKESLLTILNLDEDNRAFVANYDFAQMDLLFCNYDIYITPPPLASLTLRPFEVRVYKLK